MSDQQPATNQPAVPTQPGGQPYQAAAPAKTNTLAIVSLIFSLLGASFLPILGSIVALITGYIALGQIKRTGEGGHGLALTGVIVGWVVLGLIILFLVLVLPGVLIAISNATSTVGGVPTPG